MAVTMYLHFLCLLRLSACELIFTANLLKNIRRFVMSRDVPDSAFESEANLVDLDVGACTVHVCALSDIYIFSRLIFC